LLFPGSSGCMCLIYIAMNMQVANHTLSQRWRRKSDRQGRRDLLLPGV
jgi:hypothetical protein